MTTKTERGLFLKTSAKIKRNFALMHRELGDPTGERFENLEADKMEADAAELLALPESPGVGAGRELKITAKESNTDLYFADTIENPDMVTAKASRDRLILASEAQCLDVAVDTAETIQARNSLEKMLAHQLATAHTQALRLMKTSNDLLGHVTSWNLEGPHQNQSIEAVRLANAGARLMKSFQDGLLTLQKLRTGGRQVMVVQHVQVTDGGQAVVAGSVKGGGGSNGGDDEK